MANTKIPVELSSTPGIVDNSNATAITIDSSENVGIGTSSPVLELQIGSATAGVDANMFLAAGSNAYSRLYMGDATTGTGLYAGLLMYDHGNDAMTMFTSSTERMRIDSSGSLLVNGTSAGTHGKLQVTGDIGLTGSCTIRQSTNSDTGDTLRFLGTQFVAGSLNSMSYVYSGGGLMASLSASANAVLLDVGANSGSGHRLKVQNDASGVTGTLTYSGDLLVGRTSAVGKVDIESSKGTQLYINGLTGVSNFILFDFNGSTVGSITTNGSTTAYNTSSDSRLKDVTGEARGLEVINELNPVAYNWKADGKADEGLIAQEVLDIVPNAVTGSEEDYYQMDYSKLVVHLVKGMKEQQAQIEALQSEINTLKGE